MSTQPPDDRPDIYVPHWMTAISLGLDTALWFTLTYTPMLLGMTLLAQVAMSAFDPYTKEFWLQFCWLASLFIAAFLWYNALRFVYIYSRPVHITYQDAEGEEAPAKDDDPPTAS